MFNCNELFLLYWAHVNAWLVFRKSLFHFAFHIISLKTLPFYPMSPEYLYFPPDAPHFFLICQSRNHLKQIFERELTVKTKKYISCIQRESFTKYKNSIVAALLICCIVKETRIPTFPRKPISPLVYCISHICQPLSIHTTFNHSSLYTM